MRVYFEKIRLHYYPLVKYFISRGYTVAIFNFDYEARKIKWLRPLLDSEQVAKISHSIIGSDKFVLANVDNFSELVLKKSRLVSSLRELYGDDDLLLAYKKVLGKQLSDFYSMQIVLQKAERELFAGDRILLFPKTYTETLRLLKRSGGQIFELKKVSVPCLFGFFSVVESYFLRMCDLLKVSFINACSLCFLFGKISFSARRKEIPTATYAVLITNPQFQFKFKEYRRFDFLLDGVHITKSNTCFLLFNPICKKEKQELENSGYRILDCSIRSLFLSPRFTLSKDSWSKFTPVVRYFLSSFLNSLAESAGIVYASIQLIYTFLQWEIIMNNIKVAHVVAFNDEGLRHIGRNILFRQRGVQSWFYTYSSSYGYVNTNEDIPAQDMLHWIWCFLLYNHYVASSRQIIEFQKLHAQKIDKYYNVGCLWSEFIMRGSKKISLADFLSKYNVKNKGVKNNLKVVSFFDTSYFESVFSQYPLQDGIKFFNDIRKILEEKDDLFIIIKEKKPHTLYANTASFFYSPYNEKFSALIKLLGQHSRCYMSGYSGDPTDIIKVSDLTVCYAFSSSAIEALGARKKAIFYDPAERFRGCYYDQIPDLVAHGYEELKHLINKLIYEMSDSAYDAYLDSQIMGKADDYLDGRGLTRFRNLLSGATEPMKTENA
jgi:polysaccharide biosynthesis PFTS motif protein